MNAMLPYWNERYKARKRLPGGKMSAFKLEVVQEIVDRLNIESVIDYGCGTGITLAGLRVDRYIGLDFSPVAIEMAQQQYAGHSRIYLTTPAYVGAELAVSLDVVMHLPDGDFEAYIGSLFDMASRYVLIYGPNTDEPNKAPHMFNRRFVEWIEEHTHRVPVDVVPNRYEDKVSAFYLYRV